MKSFEKKLKYKGFSLLEILMAISIFVLMAGSVAVFSIDAVAFVKNQEISVEANSQMNQIMNAVIDYKAVNWSEFASHTGGNSKYFSTTGGVLDISDGVDVNNDITTYFTVESVYRDDDYNIVESGGLLDPYTRKVTVYSSWTDIRSILQEREVVTYVNNWEVQRWRNDVESDWILGVHDQTMGTNEDGGEVTLELIVDLLPNWCNPVLSSTYHDIPGSGIPTSVNAQEIYAFFSTGENASGEAFTKIQVNPVTYGEPTISFLGVWDVGKINYAYPIPNTNYALLGTDDNAKEVRIIQHGSTPYNEVGSFNGPGSLDVSVTTKGGNFGYASPGRMVYCFDLSSYTGSRPQVDYLSFGTSSSSITDLDYKSGYLFVGMSTDTNEMYVVDVSNPYDMTIINQISVNSMNTRDIFVTNDLTRAFILTSLSATEPELFILDISDIDGTYTVVNSLDISSMQTTSMAVVEEDHVLVVAGNSISDQDNYRVFVWEDEINIIDCGGMQLDVNINDIDATRLYDDVTGEYNYYTYAIVDDSDAEFQIVRGDEGDIGGYGYGYFREGTYYSVAYDAESPDANYHYFRWYETLVEETDLQIQIRAATTIAGLESATWIGPDGTNSTWFTEPTYAEIPDSMDGKQYMQFKVYMTTTNQDVTPVLEKIDIFYEE